MTPLESDHQNVIHVHRRTGEKLRISNILRVRKTLSMTQIKLKDLSLKPKTYKYIYFESKPIPLTFLRAHAVKVDHGRYDKSAQRAQSVRSHGDDGGGVCGWRAARCRPHDSRKFI